MSDPPQPTDVERLVFPRRFFSLDALRGLAALSVVFSHWQHFFLHGTEPQPLDKGKLPLHQLFMFFYHHGWRAVDLFFCLSGFIFFWLYSTRISERRISAREFFVLRFSRLYPLHLLTLLFVAGAQQWMMRYYGAFFVYPSNDLYHFGLQLVFASNWGFESGISFNGPAWSVSVEVLLYAMFFVVCGLKWRRFWHLALYAGCGYLMMVRAESLVGRGVFSFFLGGLSFQVFCRIVQLRLSRLSLLCLALGTGALWVIIPWNIENDILYRTYQVFGVAGNFNVHGKDIAGLLLQKFTTYSFAILLFPSTIVTLALLETRRGTLGRRLALLGDISYSSYLLHFPLQLVFFAIALSFGVNEGFFSTPVSLIIFFAVLIVISWASYRFFERPCQSWLRARMPIKQDRSVTPR